jgi:hypothetical protein
VRKPNAERSSHLRVESKRDEIPREPAHLATGGPTTDLLLAKERVQELGQLTKASCTGVDPAASVPLGADVKRTTRPSSARGPVASLLRKGRGLVNGSKKERLRGPADGALLAGETAAKGREARGAAERGHGQDAPSENEPGRVRGRGWRLAHEAF